MKAERRHELKEDAFVTFMTESWSWLRKNGKVVAGVLAAVVGITAVATGTHLYSESSGDAAWTAFAEAQQVDPAKVEDLKPEEAAEFSLDKLLAARDTLENTIAEPTYLLALADSYFRSGVEYDRKDWIGEAESFLNTLISKYPDADYIVTAHLERGKVFFEQGKFKDALGDFQKVGAITTGGAAKLDLASQAKWYEGKCLENDGNTAAAAEAYIQCIALIPEDSDPNRTGTDWGMLAERDLRNIRSGLSSTDIIKMIEKPDPKKEDEPAKDDKTKTE